MVSGHKDIMHILHYILPFCILVPHIRGGDIRVVNTHLYSVHMPPHPFYKVFSTVSSIIGEERSKTMWLIYLHWQSKDGISKLPAMYIIDPI